MNTDIVEISILFGGMNKVSTATVSHYTDELVISSTGVKYSHLAHGIENTFDSTNESSMRESRNIVLDFSAQSLGLSQAEFDWYYVRLSKHAKELGGESAPVYENATPTVITITFASGGSNSFKLPINLLGEECGKTQRKVGKYVRKLIRNVVVIDNLLTEDELKQDARHYEDLPDRELEDLDIFEPYPDD